VINELTTASPAGAGAALVPALRTDAVSVVYTTF
jgi:hypothetical protein